MILYVIRHGETNSNKNQMFNIPSEEINEIGKKQAQEAAKKLEDIKFDLIICSPHIRTRQTANIININNYKIIYDERIKERNVGKLANRKLDSLNMKEFWDYNKNNKYEDAETIHNFFNRVYLFLDEIKKNYYDKTILLVTHNGVSKVIYTYFNGMPTDGNFKGLGLKNGEIKVYYI
jgi:broad specificity phosphatase PhoE